MPNFYGKLTIGHLYSLIETHSFPTTPRKYWLLLDGYEDADQAGSAATEYIQDVKHLSTNDMVIVTGIMGAVDSQPVIVMSDINVADIDMATTHFESLVLSTRSLRKVGEKNKAKQEPGSRKRATKKSRSQE